MSEGKIGLEVRTYRCKECGLIIDRDHNAAINIKSGLERTHVEKLPLLTSERKEHVASMKQEAHII